MLYELLAGRTPFVADGPGRLIGMHLFQEPPSLLSVAPQVPPEIAELVHRMLRKEKKQRPRMKEAAESLQGNCRDRRAEGWKCDRRRKWERDAQRQVRCLGWSR